MNKTPLVTLLVLDGWGIAPPGPGNAITLASTPNFDQLIASFPHGQLIASGEAVGLPAGEMGNSETGHLNLGAGHIVFQDLPRINMAIADGTFFTTPAFLNAIEHTKKHQSRLHLMGLLSGAGVHSSFSHLTALLNLAKSQSVKQVFIHLFTDGRDSSPTEAPTYIALLQEKLAQLKVGQIATMMGRYWGMDRDLRWERTEKAYNTLVLGQGQSNPDPIKALNDSYQQKVTDEFIPPQIINPDGLIKDNDAVIFYNFRIDRPRQLTSAFVLPNFETHDFTRTSFDPYAEQYQGQKVKNFPFKRQKILQNLFFVTMTEYEKTLPVQVAYPPHPVKLPLAKILSDKNLRQLHLAETEKYPHVTVFFNGQHEQPFPNEDWMTKHSPKEISSYDQKPQMSAFEVTQEAVKQINSQQYNFILINLANPDMVGHTGNLQASVKACEITDQCLGQIATAVLAQNGICMVIADHGNVEEMINLKTGQIDTKHSTFPVPIIIVGNQFKGSGVHLQQGILADVAPTILDLMNIQRPQTMTGRSLLTSSLKK